MRLTVRELAEYLDVSMRAADGLMLFLRETGLARDYGERPGPTGRGKGARIYELAFEVETAVAEAMRRTQALRQARCQSTEGPEAGATEEAASSSTEEACMAPTGDAQEAAVEQDSRAESTG